MPGVWDPCENWCKAFEKTTSKWFTKRCIFAAGCTRVLGIGFGEQIANQFGTNFAGHVVYRIVLCDGSIVYVDNGFVGGEDHVGFPSDAPSFVLGVNPVTNRVDSCDQMMIWPNENSPGAPYRPPCNK